MPPAASPALLAEAAGGAPLVLGSGAAVFVAQLVAVQLWVPPTGVATVWLHGGLMLALTLLVPLRLRRWVIAAGGLGVGLALLAAGTVSPLEGTVLGGLSALVTLAVSWVLERTLGGRLTLGSLKEFVSYLGVAVVGGTIAASGLFLAAAWGLGFRPPSFELWRTFALAALLAYLTVTPTVVLLVQEAGRLRQIPWLRRIEVLLLALSLVALSSFVFTDTASRILAWPAFAITFPPLLVWAALRFQVLGAAGSLLVVTLISTLSTVMGHGPFTDSSTAANTLSLQLFILGTGLPLLTLAVVLGEQRRTLAMVESTQVQLQGFNRALITAREEESTRIARELHDDVGQRLAVVSIGLSRLRPAVTDSAPGAVGQITRLQEQIGSVARSLRELSHQLHPGALEHVGLAAALQMKCEEVRQVTELAIQMRSTDLPLIRQDTALCLYRVAQEALTNVVRHSGAHRVELLLASDQFGLTLEVRDDGRGFNPGAPNGRGLGLHSLTERVRLLGGRLTVDSRAGRGTTLKASIPLRSTADA